MGPTECTDHVPLAYQPSGLEMGVGATAIKVGHLQRSYCIQRTAGAAQLHWVRPGEGGHRGMGQEEEEGGGGHWEGLRSNEMGLGIAMDVQHIWKWIVSGIFTDKPEPCS